MQLTPFDKTDWNCFAGALMPKGSEPLVAFTEDRGGKQRAVIVDGKGITVEEICNSGINMSGIRMPMDFENAKTFAEAIDEDAVWKIKILPN